MIVSSIKDFADLMQAVRDIATILAVIAGGIWSLFTFNALRIRQKARAEVQELERKLKQQAVVDINIDANQLRLPGDRSLYVEIVVSIKNVGNRNTHLVSKDSPLILTEILWDGNKGNKQVEGEYYTFWGGLDYVLRVGICHKVPCVVRVENPGLYKIVFAVELSPEELDVAAEAGQEEIPSPDNQGIYWLEEKFFVVNPISIDQN
jgi:hypothetical protein